MGAVSPALREQIEDFLNTVCHALDDQQWDRWPEFFSEDAQYRILTRENHESGLPLGVMHCDGRGMMRDRMLALQTANIYEPHTYCHLLSRPTLWLQSPGGSSSEHSIEHASPSTAMSGQISARTNFIVTRTMQSGECTIFATGKYLDVIQLGDDDVSLASRTVVLDSRRIDVLLVAPI